MRRYDAVMGCSLALLLMATAVTAFLYPLWLWLFAAGSMTLMALRGVLLAVVWALYLWVARWHRSSDAPTQ